MKELSIEDKELLLKDLCARLPYGVKGRITYDKSNTTFTVEGIDNNVLHLSDAEECYVKDFNPYLRPMSSMTEEEIVELKWLNEKCDAMPTFEYVPVENYRIYDWMNRHHFDYRRLIEKGLVIKAKEGMYEKKKG